MGLLDAITGSAAKKAGRLNQAVIGNALTAGTTALNTGADKATGLLGVGNGGDALTALGQGFDRARTDINAGYDAAQPALGKLGEIYNPMVAGGQRSFDAFLDASGANGAEGSARARANFQEAPGRQYQMDQALEALQRSAAARGGLAGGNLTKDILTTATGLADQSWDGYLDNLKTGAGYYQTGLSGLGQGLTTEANAAINRGTTLGNLGGTQGAATAGLYGQGAGIQSGLGTSLANLQLGGANALVQNNNQVAAQQTAASGNFLGALFGGAKTLAGAAGGNPFSSFQFGGGGWGG